MACLVKTRHDQTFPGSNDHHITIMEGLENGRVMVEVPLAFLQEIDYNQVPFYNELSSFNEEFFLSRDHIATRTDVAHDGRCGYMCISKAVGIEWKSVFHELVSAGIFPAEAESLPVTYLPSTYWLHTGGSK